MRWQLSLGCWVAVLAWGMSVAVAGEASVSLKASDGVEIRGDLYGLDGDDPKAAPFVLLFHQAGSNRGEYAEIAPRLNRLGFNALAIDQRSGGTRWGHDNETVDRLGRSTGYLEALPDLQAALAWKREQGYDGETVVWGSSYSAALVFLLAAEHAEIDGVLSFSPGEYLGTRKDEVRRAARKVAQPVFVATPAEEEQRAATVYDAVPDGEKNTFLIPARAVHGSSMLVADRNPGADEIWPRVESFLQQFLD